ncbi:hypothetical protein CUW27_20785 [Salmonella enterica]|nr:hypothetical protein [Salmonella enterica]
MHLIDRKRALIETKRGRHAAAGLNETAMDKVILALFPQVRADGVDDFVRGYGAYSSAQERADSAAKDDVEYQRRVLMESGFDVRFDSADKVRKIYGSVFK